MRHILIVDDALDLGRLLKTALSLIDATMPIVVVPSGEEALLEGARYPLDLLITDVRLPGISGVELVHKIRRHHPDVSIIVITGLNDEQVRQDVKQLAVDYFFTKPLSMPEFTEAARRCLKLGEEPFEPGLQPTNGGSAQQEAGQQIAEVLSGLRKSLDAVAVILLNERARIEAEAGTVPENLGAESFSRLLAAANASLNVSDMLGETGREAALIFRGENFDLAMTPIEQYLLLVVLSPDATNLRLAFCLEETQFARAALKRSLNQMGLISQRKKPAPDEIAAEGQAADQISAPESPEVSTEDLQAFESIFQETRPMDVDAFWNEASSQAGGVDSEDPEVLTYEQAQRLGLVPDSDAADA